MRLSTLQPQNHVEEANIDLYIYKNTTKNGKTIGSVEQVSYILICKIRMPTVSRVQTNYKVMAIFRITLSTKPDKLVWAFNSKEGKVYALLAYLLLDF